MGIVSEGCICFTGLTLDTTASAHLADDVQNLMTFTHYSYKNVQQQTYCDTQFTVLMMVTVFNDECVKCLLLVLLWQLLLPWAVQNFCDFLP